MEPLSGNSCELKTAKFDNTVDNVDTVDKFGNVDHFGTMDVYCYIWKLLGNFPVFKLMLSKLLRSPKSSQLKSELRLVFNWKYHVTSNATSWKFKSAFMSDIDWWVVSPAMSKYCEPLFQLKSLVRENSILVNVLQEKQQQWKFSSLEIFLNW